MFKNYFKTAWRNLVRRKIFGFINIFGLAVSMSVCMLIILIINDQNSYDNFLINHDRVYRIQTQGKNGNGKPTASSPLPLADELRNYSGVQASTSLIRNLSGDLFYNNKSISAAGYFADSNFLNVLKYKLKNGNAATALTHPRSLIISDDLARKLFNNQDAIGKVITLNHSGVFGNQLTSKTSTYGQFIITGVLQQNTGKTSLHFDMLASLSTVNNLAKDSLIQFVANDDWDNVGAGYTYVLLKKGQTKSDLQSMVNKIASKEYPTTNGSNFVFTATRLKDIPGVLVSNETTTALPNVILIFLAVLCFVIMLSACLNYTNLSVAQSLTRMKEVGVRKVSGATRKQIFQQFIVESLVTSFLALLLAFVLLAFLQPLLKNLWLNNFFDFSFHYTLKTYLSFLAFSLLVGLVAGLLPAIYTSFFNPIQIFHNFNAVKGFKGLTLRKILLTVQFVVSLIFVVSGLLIYKQMQFISNFDYGFNQGNVVNIKLYKPGNYDRFAQAIASNRNIRAVSGCSYPPSSGTENSMLVFLAGEREDSVQAGFLDIDGKCLDVWDIPLVAGKNLPAIAADSTDHYVLINQKMVTAFHFPSAAAAIGQQISVGDHNVQIAGVVKDFQYQNVARSIGPLMLRNRKSEFNYVTVRIAAKDQASTIRFLQNTWRRVNPDTRFDYVFFDDQLHEVQAMLSDAAAIVGYLAFLAVTISCLGLLGMALYTAERRRKEVGIRKVLGSGVLRIIILLSKSYLILLGIAIVIAAPVAYMLNTAWLRFFASRISITPITLLESVGGLTVICFCIVGLQAWNVSRINPAKSLQTE